MKTQMLSLWKSLAPRERIVIAVLTIVLGSALYLWLVQSASRARLQLGAAVAGLHTQASRLDQDASELARLRAAPPLPVAQTELRTLVQAQVGAAGLSHAMTRIDAPDGNQVLVEFGVVAFADWLAWVSTLQAQQVRLAACRVEALSTPGLVSVSATLSRAKSQ